MKKLLFISTAIIASLQIGVAQTIYTADNNPGAVGGVNVFTGPTALTDAIAAAVDDDIIHVVRSATDYGATIIDKRLTIFGIGLNPDTDGNQRSIVSTVNIEDPVASGSRVSGLHITTILNLGGVAGILNNLLIENSLIRSIQHTSATTFLSTIVIRNNVIGSNYSTNEEKIDLLAGAISNIIIANNVIYVTNSSGNHGTITASNGTSIENNLFMGVANAGYYSFENFDGNSVKNNIFLGLRPTGFGSFTNNTFENNISFATGADGFSNTNGNVSGASNLTSQDPLLANAGAGNIIDFSIFDPTLDTVTPSPAIGTGEGGTDMGVFGGATPMNLDGTLIPLIQSLTLPSLILKGNDLPVQIQAEGN